MIYFRKIIIILFFLNVIFIVLTSLYSNVNSISTMFLVTFFQIPLLILEVLSYFLTKFFNLKYIIAIHIIFTLIIFISTFYYCLIM